MESSEFVSESTGLDSPKYWPILKRRWLPATVVLSCVVAGAAVVASVQKPVYEAQGKLLFKKINQTTAAVQLTDKDRQIGELTPLAEGTNPLNTEIEIIRSVPLLQKTIATLNLKDQYGQPLKPQTLAQQVKLSNVTASDILVLSYQSTDPKEAAKVVNQLMRNYVDANRQTNQATAVAADVFITRQMPSVESNVWQAESALRRFKEQNHVVALEAEAASAVATVQDLDKKIIDSQATLVDTSSQLVKLQSVVGMNPQDAIATNSLNQSAGVQDALKEYQQVEDQLVVEGTRFQAENPTIQTLQDKRNVLQALLQQRIVQTSGTYRPVATGSLQIGESRQKLGEDLARAEVQRAGLANQVIALSQAKDVYRQRMSVIPRLEQEQRQLTRQLEVAQSTYETFLKRLQEVRLVETENLGNVWIIESGSVPELPSDNPKAKILAWGGGLGLLLSAIAIFFLEAVDKSIKTPEEAKKLFGYASLGSIDYFGKKVSLQRQHREETTPVLAVRDAPHSSVSNAYQMLQANLEFVHSDKATQVIVVTSSVPKEGKSTVSANLATAMAYSGRRVLLVDADMRHPLQHHIWQLTNFVGLSNVIIGEAEFSKAVQEVMPRLDILTSGAIPPNPAGLLASKRMASLLETCSRNYDSIIIDTHSLVGVADAAILGRMASGILLVVRPGLVDFAKANEAKDLITRSGQNVLGLVINGVTTKTDRNLYSADEPFTEQDSTSQELVAKLGAGSGRSRN